MQMLTDSKAFSGFAVPDIEQARDNLIGAFAAEHVQETKQETSHEDLVVSACRRTRSG